MLARLWAWAKKDPIPALTIGGVLMFVFLRLPYGVYYGTLGTSPEDVGLSYVETLARSTAGLAVLAFAVGLSAAAAAGALSFVVIYGRMTLGVMTSLRGFSSKGFREMEDAEFDRVLLRTRRLWAKVVKRPDPRIDALLADSVTLRRLQILGVRAPTQQARLEGILARRTKRRTWSILGTEVRRLARWWGGFGAAVTLLAIVVSLPAVAYTDALAVRRCDAPRLGRYGLFAIRGASSDVFRIGEDGGTAPMLAERELMYLGAGGDRIVLYDCKQSRVVRLPARDVLVASL